jgi:hypothetical protein
MNPDEAREAAQRRLYREYVAGDRIKFTLSWEYLYLFPGYKIIIPSASGITYTIRLTSITGGMGIQECEGVFIEPSSFSQSAVGGEPPVYNPPHPIPSVTILAAMDLPAFRAGEGDQFGM